MSRREILLLSTKTSTLGLRLCWSGHACEVVTKTKKTIEINPRDENHLPDPAGNTRVPLPTTTTTGRERFPAIPAIAVPLPPDRANNKRHVASSRRLSTSVARLGPRDPTRPDRTDDGYAGEGAKLMKRRRRGAAARWPRYRGPGTDPASGNICWGGGVVANKTDDFNLRINTKYVDRCALN